MLGLALRNTAHHDAARRLAQQSAWGLELVLVLEVGAIAVGRQAVTGARVGSRRALALPRGAVRALGLGERPVHLEVGVSQTQCLIHLEPLARFTGIH